MPAFPKCENCGKVSWIQSQPKRLEDSVIATYKCAGCQHDMSWSFRTPGDELKYIVKAPQNG